MEFKFTEKEEDYYHEVEEFLKKELPPDWAEHNRTWPGGYGSNDLRYGTHSEIYKAYLEKLTAKGRITISWTIFVFLSGSDVSGADVLSSS